MSGAVHDLGVAALGRALRSRELSSVEATRHLLDRLAGHERLGVALALVDPRPRWPRRRRPTPGSPPATPAR